MTEFAGFSVAPSSSSPVPFKYHQMLERIMEGDVEDKRPRPLDLSHHFSRTTVNRHESEIKDFYKYFSIPGIGNLAGGLPNAGYFPFDTLEAQASLPDRFEPSSGAGKTSSTSHSTSSHRKKGPPSERIIVPRSADTTDDLRRIDITTALQYGRAEGYPPLFSFMRQFTRENMHPNCPYRYGPDIIMTCGSTDGFAKCIEALSNEWNEAHDPVEERPAILCEEFAYMGAIQTARPRGLAIVPVKVDTEGMRVDSEGGLERVLEDWDEKQGKRPHLMYTVTVGQNPTSGILSVARRQAIYSLCQKYDILIIEDDPYWALQYPSSYAANDLPLPEFSDLPDRKSSGYPFLDSLVPSYLSLDPDGRVLRLDTFSKTIGPGCRLGWITAQPAMIERLLRITEVSTQQPSGFVQALVAQLLMGSDNHHDANHSHNSSNSSSNAATTTTTKAWKFDGWVRWLAGLRGSYERRVQTLCTALNAGRHTLRSYPQRYSRDRTDVWEAISRVPMFDFSWPLGGMFVWLRLNLSSHPLYGLVPQQTLARALWVHLTANPWKVLVAPGTIFCPTQQQRRLGWSFFRVCFAAVKEEEVESMADRLVRGFEAFWEKKDIGEMRRGNVEVEFEEGDGWEVGGRGVVC